MFDLRLINAELLKTSRRRGMLAIAVLITMGFGALAFVVSAIQHATDPAKHAAAGGLASLQDARPTVLLLVLIMASIVGATAGTQDLESGVFRDLAATGRARGALFGARFTGALGVTLPITALTAAMLAAGSLLLADGTPLPQAGDIVAATGLLVAAAVLATAAGVGAGALFGSRGPVIGLLLGFFLAIDPLLASIGFLGDARAIVPSEALHRIGGMPVQTHLGAGVAIAVVAAWVAAALGAGAWRTQHREV